MHVNGAWYGMAWHSESFIWDGIGIGIGIGYLIWVESMHVREQGMITTTVSSISLAF